MSPLEKDSAQSPEQAVEEPNRVGPYKLLETLGEGGMGVVYLAEQTGPLKREVALKLIKPGMDTKQVVARFEAERQALGVMNHPHIAKVYDGGATESGRPFFVMELVRGVPVNEYCDMHRLSIRDRLKLIIGVCQAVQHAHQKGVMHRDLKPSNILVIVQDGKPVPKVIDFGIAKAIGHRLTEQTLHTMRGQLIGTPVYMSPEQAEMTGLDVDTRTDIYSLGVILYELLAGELPFEEKDLRGLAAISILRETDPPTPSARFKTLGDRQQIVAERRHTDPRALSRRLKGDLDWITMKAMDKDRTRRYETANGLALDLQRFLNGQPVLARAPGVSYRVNKFVRRHAIGVGFGTLLVALLIGFASTMSVQAARIARERDRANQEAEVAEQVTEFLLGLFEVSDPSEARGSTVTAREILDNGAAQVTEELADRPLTQARLMHMMGRVYTNLGLYESAEPLLKQSLDLRRNQVGEDHPEVASVMYNLGTLFLRQGRFAEADTYLTRSLAIREKVLPLADTAKIENVNTLAVLSAIQGHWSDAEQSFQSALYLCEQALGWEHPKVAGVLNNLALVYKYQERYDTAGSLLLLSLKILEKTLGADHPDVAAGYNNLATVYGLQGMDDEAEELYWRSLKLTERLLGPAHPDLAVNLFDFAEFYHSRERYPEAEPLYRRALRIRETALGSDHPDVAESSHALGVLYSNQERYDEAEPLFAQALAIREDLLGPQSRLVAETLSAYAELLRLTGRAERAGSLETRARTILSDLAETEPQE